MLVLPIPHPDIPEQHEPWCPLGKVKFYNLNALFTSLKVTNLYEMGVKVNSSLKLAHRVTYFFFGLVDLCMGFVCLINITDCNYFYYTHRLYL